MKKYFKWMGVAVFAFVMFLTTGTTGKAVSSANMEVAQSSASSSSVIIGWKAPVGYTHFHVLLSDGLQAIDYGDTTSKTMSIYGLNAGTAYKVQVCAFTGSHSAACTLANAELVSEVATISTKLGKITNLVQTDATSSTVALKWDAVAGAEAYRVYVYAGGWQQCAASTTNSVTVTGLYPSSRNWYKVMPVRLAAGGYIVEGGDNTVYGKSAPAQVAYARPTLLYSNIDVLYLGWSSVTNADGYQLQVQTMKGKNLLFEDQGLATQKRISPYWRGKVFKVRARAYIQVGLKRVYGPWSSYSYSAESKKVKAVRSANRKKIKLTWKKVSGVSRYVIYISTRSDGGWKKVKALGSKKTKYTITKCGKKKLSKRKTYYLQFKYQIKVGKKKITTAIVDKSSCI